MRPLPSSMATPLRAQPVELVDGAQHGEPLGRVGLGDRIDADAGQHPVQHLAVVDLDHVLAARDAQRLQRVGRQHADLGVGGDVVGAHRVGVELGELAEAAGARLLVAPHGADGVAAEGLGQLVEVLGHVAGERRGQVVAQRQPLLVLVLEREHALVGPVLVGQELAQRIGVLDGRRLQRLEAVGLVHLADDGQHAAGAAHLVRGRVAQAPGQSRLGSRIAVRFGHRVREVAEILGAYNRSVGPRKARVSGVRPLAKDLAI